jgi:hypothetical protein
MKGASTGFEIVPLSEVRTNVVSIKQGQPSQAQLKQVPGRRNDSQEAVSAFPDSQASGTMGPERDLL